MGEKKPLSQQASCGAYQSSQYAGDGSELQLDGDGKFEILFQNKQTNKTPKPNNSDTTLRPIHFSTASLEYSLHSPTSLGKGTLSIYKGIVCI